MESYPSQNFRSLDHLCEMISDQTRGWDSIWYRGVPLPIYTLLPTVLRDSRLKARESYNAIEFRRRARPLNLDISDAFSCLCSMQHYGIPTRLLDWTESLSVALYFAANFSAGSSCVPTIWVLDPRRLYNLTDLADIIPVALHENVVANADIAFDDDPSLHEKRQTKFPLPVLPEFNSPRLAAQNGVFTIHEKDDGAIESIIPKTKRDMLLKFVANEGFCDRIIASIDLIKPTHHSIFPDIDGLKSYLL